MLLVNLQPSIKKVIKRQKAAPEAMNKPQNVK